MWSRERERIRIVVTRLHHVPRDGNDLGRRGVASCSIEHHRVVVVSQVECCTVAHVGEDLCGGIGGEDEVGRDEVDVGGVVVAVGDGWGEDDGGSDGGEDFDGLLGGDFSDVDGGERRYQKVV